MSDAQSVRTPAWLTLSPDERVLMRARPSTSLVLGGVAGGFVLIIAGSLPFMATGAVDAGRRVSFVLLAVVFVAIVSVFLLIRGREYVLTNRRAIVAVGLRDAEVRTVDLDVVRDVSLEQDRWQRWISVGDLRFVTDDDALTFGHVGSPQFVYQRALEVV